jgi:hypothetical protein
MSRRIGYGRATSELAAEHIVARLRVAGCTHLVIDQGSGTDPLPEWSKLSKALRPGDTLVIATLPHDRQRREQVRQRLNDLATERAIIVEVLLGARLRQPGVGTPPAGRTLSAGQVGGTLNRLGSHHPTRRPPAGGNV